MKRKSTIAVPAIHSQPVDRRLGGAAGCGRDGGLDRFEEIATLAHLLWQTRQAPLLPDK